MANPDHILFLLSRLQEKASRHLTRELNSRGIEGIEPSHGAIIRQLSIHGSLSMSKLAELIDRTRPTLTVLVNKLVKKGTVERIQDPMDKRVTQIRLTEQTKQIEGQFQEVSRGLRQTIYQGFSQKEQLDIVNQLEKAIQNFAGK